MTQTILSRQAVRFGDITSKLLFTLEDPNVRPARVASICDSLPPQKVYLLSCGVLNMLWQEWNRFCRNYWMIFVYGGGLSSTITIQSIQTVAAINVVRSKPKTIYNFLESTNGRYRRNFTRRIIMESSEPAWGASYSLGEISTYYQNFYNEISFLTGGLSIMGNVLDHIQIVRNAAIHLNQSTCNKLNSVSPYYAFNHRVNYPTDYMFARELRTGKVAIQYWIDEVNALAQLMCN